MSDCPFSHFLKLSGLCMLGRNGGTEKRGYMSLIASLYDRLTVATACLHEFMSLCFCLLFYMLSLTTDHLPYLTLPYLTSPALTSLTIHNTHLITYTHQNHIITYLSLHTIAKNDDTNTASHHRLRILPTLQNTELKVKLKNKVRINVDVDIDFIGS